MKKTFNVDKTFNAIRIDKWIRKKIGNLPQSLLEKNLRIGKIKINNKKIKSSYKLSINDKISIFDLNFTPFKKNKKAEFQPSKKIIKYNEETIIDNNDNFIVINKKSGVPVQGGTKSKKNLIDIFKKSEFFINSKPYSVHRLDKDTSGILIIAKNRETAQILTSLFRLRKVHKTYLAICHGQILKKSGELNSELIRYENNKAIREKAITHYRVIDTNSSLTLLEMKPITGRKHQLRKQLLQIGHPIYGDQKYNFGYNNIKNKNLMLHAYKIKFMIKNEKFNFHALLPKYFQDLLKAKKIISSSFLKSL